MKAYYVNPASYDSLAGKAPGFNLDTEAKEAAAEDESDNAEPAKKDALQINGENMYSAPRLMQVRSMGAPPPKEQNPPNQADISF